MANLATRHWRQGDIPTLSYAEFSTYIIFSMPLTFAAFSATDFTPLPATKAVIEPPSFVPAVTAARDEIFSFPSLCSRTASVESNRDRAEYWRAVADWGRSPGRTCRRTDLRATENILEVIEGFRRESKARDPGAGWNLATELARAKHASEEDDLGLSRFAAAGRVRVRASQPQFTCKTHVTALANLGKFTGPPRVYATRTSHPLHPHPHSLEPSPPSLIIAIAFSSAERPR